VRVEPQPPIEPNEIRGILFVIADIGEQVEAIRNILEEEIDGEDPEDDA
jgi:hypothetical protein